MNKVDEVQNFTEYKPKYNEGKIEKDPEIHKDYVKEVEKCL